MACPFYQSHQLVQHLVVYLITIGKYSSACWNNNARHCYHGTLQYRLQPYYQQLPDFHRWISPAYVEASAQQVDWPKDILQVLQDMPNFQIKSLQEKGAAARSYFRYRHIDSAEALHGPRTATDAIIQNACQRASQASNGN